MSGFDSLTKDSKAQGYWVNRVIAYIIDAIIVYIVTGILAFLVFLPIFFAGGFAFYSFFYVGLFGVFSLFAGLLFILYFTFFDATRGGTIGKSLFHLKVQGSDGKNPTFVQAFVRNLSKIYWLLLLLDVILGLATTKGYQQKYTDHMMGTTVASA